LGVFSDKLLKVLKALMQIYNVPAAKAFAGAAFWEMALTG